MSDITGTIEFHSASITEDDIDTLRSELMTHLDLYGNEGGALNSTNVNVTVDRLGKEYFRAIFDTDYDKADWDGHGARDAKELENYQAMLYGFIDTINAHGKATYMSIFRDNGMDAVNGPEITIYTINSKDKTKIFKSEAFVTFAKRIPVSR